MWTTPEIERLVRRIAARLQARAVILFGSYSKGTATARSDLDLLVIAETPLPMTRRADEIKPILGQILFPVDVHVYTPEEVEQSAREAGSFIHSVLRTGRVVWADAKQVESVAECSSSEPAPHG